MVVEYVAEDINLSLQYIIGGVFSFLRIYTWTIYSSTPEQALWVLKTKGASGKIKKEEKCSILSVIFCCEILVYNLL